MAAKKFFLPGRSAIDLNGMVVSGAEVTFYETGTTTKQSVFSSDSLATPLTNPVIANAAGKFPTIYLDSTKVYRVRGYAPDSGELLFDVDPYYAGDPAEASDELLEASASAQASAATAESAAGPTYASTASGLAATTNGQGFAVNNGDGTVTIYLNDGGAAVEQRTLATTAALASPDEGKGLNLVDFSHPAPQAAKGFPAYNFRTQRRNLADFIEKDQWAAIRNGTATDTATNGYGVDAYSAALSDMAGAVGGEIEVPDGLFILPQILASQTNLTLRGRGSSTTIKTTSATEHQIDVRVPFVTIADMVFTSSVPRTAGACIRVRNDAPRFVCEGVTSYNAFTLLQIDGHPTDPSLDSGVFNASRLRAYNSVEGGYPYRIGGGYVVTLDDVHAIGDPGISALNGPAAGLYVTRCADLRVQGNSQFLNCQRSIDVMPATGSTVASFKMEGVYCGTSYYGSRLSCANGGNIVSFGANGVWFGENLNAGGGTTGSGNGLSLIGSASGRFKQAVLSMCEFPLAQFNGLECDQHVSGVQVIGGWADGCGGSGYAFGNTQDWLLQGVRSGSQRFGGNARPYYIDSAADYFRVIGNDFRDNGAAGANLAGTSATKILANNVGS